MSGTGIFGGSFDPVHMGHINLAKAALRLLKLDKLMMIPVFDSPFKIGQKNAGDKERLEMCRLAAADEKKIKVSDIEIKAGGISYTYNTVQKFSKPGQKLYLIMGSDAFLTVQSWKYSTLIKQDVFVVGGCRDKAERERLEKHADWLAAIGFGVALIDYDPVTVSSTEIRELIKEKKSTEGLLDPAVREYIDKNGLYNT